MNNHDSSRILAIEVRRSRFGYALFEGPKRLVDWGARAIPPGCTDQEAIEVARKRASSVLRRGSPTAIVVGRPLRLKAKLVAAKGHVFGAILREARALQIPLHFMHRKKVRETLRVFRARSKEQVAWILASAFPELIDRLPPKRKKWQHESRGMVLFDAVAIGFAYWLERGVDFNIQGPDYAR